MVSIRLSRGGARKYPFYHIVVTDSRNRRDGRYIERLGFFRPTAVPGEETLRLDVARAEYWIGQGAKPSERAAKLIDGLRKGKLATVAPKPEAVKPEVKAEADKAEAGKPKAKKPKAAKAAAEQPEEKAAAPEAEKADAPEAEEPAAPETKSAPGGEQA